MLCLTFSRVNRKVTGSPTPERRCTMASSESMPELNAVSSQRSFKDRMLRSITNFPLGQFMPGGEKQADSNLSTQDDDAPPVKKGWLRKQGGVVKNWHSRYFVLRGHTLYYYMSNDESKLLGTIILAGNKVVEYPVSPAEPDKFPFEILPGENSVMAKYIT